MTGRTWAVSCYFNPIGYRRRLENYHTFRRHLSAPLVTVELGFGGFDLRGGDADILIQVDGTDVLWQKERLLNIAVRALPQECEYVAWLDADIVFRQGDWPARLERVLERHSLAQLFHKSRHLGPSESVDSPRSSGARLVTDGFAARMTNGSLPPSVFSNQGRSQKLGYSPGFAWASRRETIEELTLYDAMIMGGGDKVVAAAAYGRIEETVEAYAMNACQARHFRAWAGPFFKRIRGDIGHVEGMIFHLWHGRQRDRRIGTRYQGFEEFGFDPFRDIRIDGNGCWRWNSAKPELHRFVKDYFASRREDGEGGP